MDVQDRVVVAGAERGERGELLTHAFRGGLSPLFAALITMRNAPGGTPIAAGQRRSPSVRGRYTVVSAAWGT